VWAGREVHLHFHLRYGPVNLHLQIHYPISGQDALHLAAVWRKDLQIRAIGAYQMDCLPPVGTFLMRSLRYVLYVAIEPGSVDELLNLASVLS